MSKEKVVSSVLKGATALCIVLALVGCGGYSLEKISEISEVFRAGSPFLDDAAAFTAVLETFDFENAEFVREMRNALEKGRGASGELRVNNEELRGFEYGGDLASLGRHIEEYSSAVEEAFDELEEIYSGLDGILLAMEPVLREEAVITQMEAPRSDEELQARLARLDPAIAQSLRELKEVKVPVLLEEYKSLFEELLATMHKLIVEMEAVVAGLIPDVKVDSNPDFLYIRELLAGYGPVVDRLNAGLKVSAIDPLVENVELEINRLYLGVD